MCRNENFPVEEPSCLQYIVAQAGIKKRTDGVVKSFCIHQKDHKNCKYYADRFKGGRDLERRTHERVQQRAVRRM
jgi:hypothetical protein